jgi:hypothetical protein
LDAAIQILSDTLGAVPEDHHFINQIASFVTLSDGASFARCVTGATHAQIGLFLRKSRQ